MRGCPRPGPRRWWRYRRPRNPEWTFRISVSRHVVFHSTALAGSGLYLLIIAGARLLHALLRRRVGRGCSWRCCLRRRAVPGVVFFSGPSGPAAGVPRQAFLCLPVRLPHRVAGRDPGPVGGGDGLSLGESVVKALADLVESPVVASGCGMPTAVSASRRGSTCRTMACGAGGFRVCPLHAGAQWIVNLQEARSGFSPDVKAPLPEWASELADMWLIVPLISSGVLVGFVVLLTPRTPVDELGSPGSAQDGGPAGEPAIAADAGRPRPCSRPKKFDAFNRMSAFVVHDLKNLVAQMSLMLRNAERHKDNPEFQADMLDTVRHVEERMRGLMAQLMEKPRSTSASR